MKKTVWNAHKSGQSNLSCASITISCRYFCTMKPNNFCSKFRKSIWHAFTKIQHWQVTNHGIPFCNGFGISNANYHSHSGRHILQPTFEPKIWQHLRIYCQQIHVHVTVFAVHSCATKTRRHETIKAATWAPAWSKDADSIAFWQNTPVTWAAVIIFVDIDNDFDLNCPQIDSAESRGKLKQQRQQQRQQPQAKHAMASGGQAPRPRQRREQPSERPADAQTINQPKKTSQTQGSPPKQDNPKGSERRARPTESEQDQSDLSAGCWCWLMV